MSHLGNSVEPEAASELAAVSAMNFASNWSLGPIECATSAGLLGLAHLFERGGEVSELDIDFTGSRDGSPQLLPLAESLCRNNTELRRFALCIPQNKGSGHRIVVAEAVYTALAGRNGAVEEIMLWNSGLDPQDARLLANALRAMVRIDLTGNYLGDEGAEVVANSARLGLRELLLSANDIGNNGAEAVARLISRESNSLQIVRLDINRIRATGFKALGTAVARRGRVRHLDLATNFAKPDAVVGLVQSFSSAGPLSLCSLNLGRNSMGEEGAGAISEALQRGAKVHNLNLKHNDVPLEGITALALALSSPLSSGLRELDLSENDVYDAAAEKLGDMLCANRILTELRLDMNMIGDRGAERIADALKGKNRTLRRLSLLGNKIGVHGAKAFGTMLAQNNMLLMLNMSANRVLDQGAEYLGNALCHNTGLELLWLEDCKIGNAGGVSLAAALRVNKDLGQVKLSGNQFDGQTIALLEGLSNSDRTISC